MIQLRFAEFSTAHTSFRLGTSNINKVYVHKIQNISIVPTARGIKTFVRIKKKSLDTEKGARVCV